MNIVVTVYVINIVILEVVTLCAIGVLFDC